MSVYDRDDLDEPRWFEWAAIGLALLIQRVMYGKQEGIMKHKHPDRVAETYRRDGERLVWIGYAVDQPPGATWDDEILGWVLADQAAPTS